jgi:hypothetical protein
VSRIGRREGENAKTPRWLDPLRRACSSDTGTSWHSMPWRCRPLAVPTPGRWRVLRHVFLAVLGVSSLDGPLSAWSLRHIALSVRDRRRGSTDNAIMAKLLGRGYLPKVLISAARCLISDTWRSAFLSDTWRSAFRQSSCQSVSQFNIGDSKRTPSAVNSAARASIGANVAIWSASATLSQILTLCIA